MINISKMTLQELISYENKLKSDIEKRNMLKLKNLEYAELRELIINK